MRSGVEVVNMLNYYCFPMFDVYYKMERMKLCFISVPPLEGFVMNRVLGDYFETLLYKIFVSIDEHTTVSEVGHLS